MQGASLSRGSSKRFRIYSAECPLPWLATEEKGRCLLAGSALPRECMLTSFPSCRHFQHAGEFVDLGSKTRRVARRVQQSLRPSMFMDPEVFTHCMYIFRFFGRDINSYLRVHISRPIVRGVQDEILVLVRCPCPDRAVVASLKRKSALVPASRPR